LFLAALKKPENPIFFKGNALGGVNIFNLLSLKLLTAISMVAKLA
jgi:hypothetical protein